MNILLTNDDGWDAPGIQALASVAREFGTVWIVGPAQHVSGASHQVTWAGTVRLEEKSPMVFAVEGFPTDCVRIAFSQLGIEFDWVLSGINNGGNLGSDIYVSGTVAAAREAALLGCHAIAFSQHRKRFADPDFDWQPAQVMARRVLEQVLNPAHENSAPFTRNINFPDISLEQAHTAAIESCELDRNPLPIAYRQTQPGLLAPEIAYNQRKQSKDSDVFHCFAGTYHGDWFRLCTSDNGWRNRKRFELNVKRTEPHHQLLFSKLLNLLGDFQAKSLPLRNA